MNGQNKKTRKKLNKTHLLAVKQILRKCVLFTFDHGIYKKKKNNSDLLITNENAYVYSGRFSAGK